MTTNHPEIDLDALRARIDEMEAAKAAQPERLADAKRVRELERAETLDREPWLSLINAVPLVNERGELTGMGGFPGVDAKEIFGCRLAFDLASNPGDVMDTITDYFSLLGHDVEHTMIVQSAALATLIEGVVRPLLDELERSASNYIARVNIADAAAKAWSVRVGGDDQ